MSRIEACFSGLREAGRKALIPYITGGYPNPEVTAPMMHQLVESGADIIELGVPFSDPMADGPVIQKAGEAALAAGMTLARLLQIVGEFRQRDATTPVVLMGYLNPIERMGYAAFAEAAAAAGVDGVLTVDLPPEEAADLSARLANVGLDPIFLLAPTSSLERIEKVAAVARGYVYYVALKGITGSSTLDVASVEEKLLAVYQFIDLPVGVGFGIKDAASAAAIARIADAAVVGSVLVQLLGDYADKPEQMYSAVGELVSGMRAAMDQVQ